MLALIEHERCAVNNTHVRLYDEIDTNILMVARVYVYLLGAPNFASFSQFRHR